MRDVQTTCMLFWMKFQNLIQVVSGVTACRFRVSGRHSCVQACKVPWLVAQVSSIYLAYPSTNAVDVLVSEAGSLVGGALF